MLAVLELIKRTVLCRDFISDKEKNPVNSNLLSKQLPVVSEVTYLTFLKSGKITLKKF